MTLYYPLTTYAQNGETERVIEYIKNLDSFITDKEENFYCKQDSCNDALIWASTYNQLETIQAVIDIGADLNRPGSRNHLPVCTAAREGQIEAVKLLLKNGADPFLKDCHKKNAYEHAKFKKHEHIKEFLYEYMDLANKCVNKSINRND